MSKGPEAEKMLACVGQKFGWELGCPNWISRFTGDPWEMQRLYQVKTRKDLESYLEEFKFGKTGRHGKRLKYCSIFSLQ